MDVKHEVAIQADELTDILGPSHEKERYEGNDVAGVVTGNLDAGWGDILFIETSIVKGKELTLTGNLGDVMKSAVILQYLKAHAEELGLDPKSSTSMTCTSMCLPAPFPRMAPPPASPC